MTNMKKEKFSHSLKYKEILSQKTILESLFLFFSKIESILNLYTTIFLQKIIKRAAFALIFALIFVGDVSGQFADPGISGAFFRNSNRFYRANA